MQLNLTSKPEPAIISLLPHLSSNANKIRRRGREVEGTPLLREHVDKIRIKGSNPFVSAKIILVLQ